MASDSVKLYSAIYLALLLAAVINFVLFEVEFFEFTYQQAFAGTMALTGLIIAYFQHLRWENRSLTYLLGLAFALTMLLMAAAAYSIS